MNTPGPWLALQTKPRSEQKIEYMLRQKGYESFTPMYRRKRRWSDRIVEIDSPLFPMYVFCRLNPSMQNKAISTPGVIRIVGFGGKPAPVAAEEIEALQLLSQSKYLREPWRYLPDGTAVLVETGPLTGIQGTICQDESKRRLVISITLLQRSVAIQLDDETVITVVADVKGSRTGLSSESEMAVRLLQRKALP